MIVRALDPIGDWTFGKGKNNYLRDDFAIGQNLITRVKSFLGDCFFDIRAGIDWFNLLGSKNQVALNLAISSVILKTEGITELTQLSVSLDSKRLLTIVYNVKTRFGGAISGSLGFLLTQDGLVLTTQNGEPISA